MNLKGKFGQRRALAAAAVTLLAVFSISASGTRPVEKSEDVIEEMSVDFREDFNGSFIDESIWTIADWEEHGGKTGPERCFVKDGYLHMVVINNDGEILSSAIQTKQEFRYGRWEAR